MITDLLGISVDQQGPTPVVALNTISEHRSWRRKKACLHVWGLDQSPSSDKPAGNEKRNAGPLKL